MTELVTSLKVPEPILTGRAVLLPDFRALLDIAQASGAVALFGPGEGASLAETLAMLKRHPAQRKMVAQKGMEWIHSHLSWNPRAESALRSYGVWDTQLSRQRHHRKCLHRRG